MRGRRDPFSRPLDRILEALRAGYLDAYSAHPERMGIWAACCPSCRGFSFGRRTLTICESHPGAAVALWCQWGCSEGEILAALYPPPKPPPIADPLVVGRLAVEVLAHRRQAAEGVSA